MFISKLPRIVYINYHNLSSKLLKVELRSRKLVYKSVLYICVDYLKHRYSLNNKSMNRNKKKNINTNKVTYVLSLFEGDMSKEKNVLINNVSLI